MQAGEKLVTQLGRFARLVGRDVSPDALMFFADVVCNEVGEQAACDALVVHAGRSNKFPTPADLVAIAKPTPTDRQEASDLASQLLAAIGRRGHTWPQVFRYDGHASFDSALRAELGDAAVWVVARNGGWVRFCESYGDENVAAARAQLRDLCETVLAKARAGTLDVKVGLPSPAVSSGRLTSIADVMRGLGTTQEIARVPTTVTDDELPF